MSRRSKRIIAQNNCTQGTVTELKKCWWLKINTKPVRQHSLDGAVFPETVYFHYSVMNREYTGHKFIGLNTRNIHTGDKITVYFDSEHPERCVLADVCGRELL